MKLKLIEKGAISNCYVYPIIDVILDELKKLHNKVAETDSKKYPCVIFTLTYQDGVIHAFERFMQNYRTGEYNCPDIIGRLARSYESLVKKCHSSNNYLDEAYYEGYLNGIILIGACNEDPTFSNYFPYLYLPGAKQDLSSYEIFLEELTRISKGNSKYNKFAKTYVKRIKGNDIVIHHPPY